jgi:hypothetical protein
MVEAEDDGINIAGDVSSVGLPQRGIRGEAFFHRRSRRGIGYRARREML